MHPESISVACSECTDEGISCIYVEEGKLNTGGETEAVFLNAPDQQFHEDKV